MKATPPDAQETPRKPFRPLPVDREKARKRIARLSSQSALDRLLAGIPIRLAVAESPYAELPDGLHPIKQSIEAHRRLSMMPLMLGLVLAIGSELKAPEELALEVLYLSLISTALLWAPVSWGIFLSGRKRARTAISGSGARNRGGAVNPRWMPATRRLVAVAVARLVRFFDSSFKAGAYLEQFNDEGVGLSDDVPASVRVNAHARKKIGLGKKSRIKRVIAGPYTACLIASFALEEAEGGNKSGFQRWEALTVSARDVSAVVDSGNHGVTKGEDTSVNSSPLKMLGSEDARQVANNPAQDGKCDSCWSHKEQQEVLIGVIIGSVIAVGFMYWHSRYWPV